MAGCQFFGCVFMNTERISSKLDETSTYYGVEPALNSVGDMFLAGYSGQDSSIFPARLANNTKDLVYLAH